MFNKSLLLMMVASLNACGGGSTNDGGSLTEGGSIVQGDTSNCVHIGHPALNSKHTSAAGVPSPSNTFEYLSLSNTSSIVTVRSETEANLLTSTSSFYIEDNYQYRTRSQGDQTNASGELTFSQTRYYDPYDKVPYGEFCENQEWQSSYQDRAETIIDGVQQLDQISDVTSAGKILGINISKTVEAGVFNTVKLSLEGSTIKNIWWVDTETGAQVYGEVYQSGELLYTSELASIVL